MPPAAARLLRFLPAVVVLGVVGALVLPPLLRGDADLRRETKALEARLCAPSEREALLADVRAFVDRHRADDAAVWTAIDVLARAHAVQAAVAVWADDDARRTAPGSPKRLARLLLEGLAQETCGEAWETTPLFPRCAQARIDAGDASAAEALDVVVARLAANGVLSLYAPMHRTPSPAQDRLAAALLRRTDVPELFAAGAVLAARPGDTTHAAALQRFVASDWRLVRPFFFQHLTRALGTIGGDDVRAFLAERRAWEATAGEDTEGRRQLALDVGLVLAGDAAAGDRILAAAASKRIESWAVHRWVLGLGVALASGHRDAGATLVRLWDRVDDPETRLQIATSVLLADPAPPDDLPLDAWAEGLAGQPTRVARTVAHAWALRRGRPDATALLVGDVLETVRAHDVARPEAFDDDATAAFLEALRALVRWS